MDLTGSSQNLLTRHLGPHLWLHQRLRSVDMIRGIQNLARLASSASPCPFPSSLLAFVFVRVDDVLHLTTSLNMVSLLGSSAHRGCQAGYPWRVSLAGSEILSVGLSFPWQWSKAWMSVPGRILFHLLNPKSCALCHLRVDGIRWLQSRHA